jgi:hypothetical protein
VSQFAISKNELSYPLVSTMEEIQGCCLRHKGIFNTHSSTLIARDGTMDQIVLGGHDTELTPQVGTTQASEDGYAVGANNSCKITMKVLALAPRGSVTSSLRESQNMFCHWECDPSPPWRRKDGTSTPFYLCSQSFISWELHKCSQPHWDGEVQVGIWEQL